MEELTGVFTIAELVYGGPDEPLFASVKIDMNEFMEVDAMFHMMCEVVAQLEKAGATPEQIQQYREEAINGNPYAVTPRWVTVR